MLNKINLLEDRIKKLEDPIVGYAVFHEDGEFNCLGLCPLNSYLGDVLSFRESDVGKTHDGFVKLGEYCFKEENIFYISDDAEKKADKFSKKLKGKKNERED